MSILVGLGLIAGYIILGLLFTLALQEYEIDMQDDYSKADGWVITAMVLIWPLLCAILLALRIFGWLIHWKSWKERNHTRTQINNGRRT